MTDDSEMIGPFTRPLRRDPALWVTLAVVGVATLGNAARAWSESTSLTNALVIAALTLVLSAIATMFVVAVLVGIPRGWQRGRRAGGDR